MASIINASLEDLKETFEFLDDWEDRYAYIIELGKLLPAMDDALKTDTSLVRGCTSRVWIVTKKSKNSEGNTCIDFIADSDAQIVKGLICILIMLYSGKTCEEIVAIDAEAFMKSLGLDQHLSPSRRNGLFSMVQRIEDLTQL